MGTVASMARAGKSLQPLDSAIARTLSTAVAESGLTRRVLAEVTGMSANRIGIILREEGPPATVGEVGLIGEAVGLDASTVIGRADHAISNASASVTPLHRGSPAYDDDIDHLITLNPAASDPTEGYDPDAEVEAQQDQP